MFTNTQFFDFDAGQDPDLHLSPFAGRDEPARATATAPEKETAAPMDFLQGAFGCILQFLFEDVVPLVLWRCRSIPSSGCCAGTVYQTDTRRAQAHHSPGIIYHNRLDPRGCTWGTLREEGRGGGARHEDAQAEHKHSTSTASAPPKWACSAAAHEHPTPPQPSGSLTHSPSAEEQPTRGIESASAARASVIGLLPLSAVLLPFLSSFSLWPRFPHPGYRWCHVT